MIEILIILSLILEDDVDMDVNIVNQVKGIMEPIKNDADWDIIYFGHCLEERNNPRNIIHSSSTIQPPSKYPTYAKDYQSQRFHLAKAVRPLCLHAYAVSLRGAIKILSHIPISTDEIKLQIDDSIADLLQQGKLEGYTVNPQMIIQKRKGMKSDLRPDSYLYDLGEPDPIHSAEFESKKKSDW